MLQEGPNADLGLPLEWILLDRSQSGSSQQAGCTQKALSAQLPVPPSAHLIQISCRAPGEELQTHQDGFGVFSISLGMNNEF